MTHPRALLVLILIALALQVGLLAGGGLEILAQDRRLADPDGYMRLLQAERLWLSGDWYDRFLPLTNHPHGETLHWTRPFDVLLLAGALPLGFGLTPVDALFTWGALLSPALLLVAFAVLSWGCRPVLGGWGVVLAGAGLLVAPVTRAVFMIGRPDHHSLQMVLFLAGLMVLLRMAHAGRPGREALVAGVLAGVGLWVSVEGMIAILTNLVALGLLWLIWGGGWLAGIARYLVGLAGMIGIAFLLDRPPAEWLVEEHDRLSAVHLLLGAALAATWGVLGRSRAVQEAGLRGRLLAGLFGGLVPAGVMAAAYPAFFTGPFATMHAEMGAQWQDWIKEMQPLLSDGQAGLAVLALGPAVLALVFLLDRLRNPEGAQQRVSILFLATLGIVLPIGLGATRLAAYPEVTAAVPWAMLLIVLLQWRSPLRVPAFGAVLLGPMLVALGVGASASTAASPRCAWETVAPTLLVLDGKGDQPPSFLTYVHQGPELAWRIRRPVVGSPFQRNHRGVLDTHRVLGATDPEDARRVLVERRINFVVACRSVREATRYGEGTLLSRLLEGHPPGWLRPRVLPPAADDFVLYEMAE